MAGSTHFQRVKHIYASGLSAPTLHRVSLGYGRATLEASLNDGPEAPHMSSYLLMSAAAALAAGTVEKDYVVVPLQFVVRVLDATYEGPVVATAEVLLVDGSSSSFVRAVLRSPEGRPLAEATGVFQPGGNRLPDMGIFDEREAPSHPASLMPVYPTPVGLLCLN